MEYGAIDLHKKESQIRILTEDGEIVDRRIVTTRERLTTVFWGRPRMRILLEAATESEWVAQHLETLGHEVIVADPNFTAMYGHRSRRVKTDRRDVAALVEEPVSTQHLARVRTNESTASSRPTLELGQPRRGGRHTPNG